MPWRVETPMSQRQDFVEAWARGHWHPTELCARFGIRRKTGYKWWHRYERGGLAALGALLIRTRQAHPTWGPRKLLAYLIHRHPRYTGWPVASTAVALLKREGLARARRRPLAPGQPGRRSPPGARAASSRGSAEPTACPAVRTSAAANPSRRGPCRRASDGREDGASSPEPAPRRNRPCRNRPCRHRSR
jgi:hypothetical protein